MGTERKATVPTARLSTTSSSSVSRQSERRSAARFPSSPVIGARGGTRQWVGLDVRSTSKGVLLTCQMAISRRTLLAALGLLVSVSGAAGSCTSTFVQAL